MRAGVGSSEVMPGRDWFDTVVPADRVPATATWSVVGRGTRPVTICEGLKVGAEINMLIIAINNVNNSILRLQLTNQWPQICGRLVGCQQTSKTWPAEQCQSAAPIGSVRPQAGHCSGQKRGRTSVHPGCQNV